MCQDSQSGWRGGILVLLYVNQEFSIDRFYTLGDRIYKVIREVRKTTRTTYESGTSGALGPELVASFPEVETTIRFWRWPVNAQYGERKGEYEFALVDDGFLRVFDFDLIRGDPEIAFRFPNSVIITEDMARHLFGDDDPMGRSFTLESTVFPGEYTVTGDPEGAASLVRPLFSDPLNNGDDSGGSAGQVDNVAANALLAAGGDFCTAQSGT